MKLTGLSYKPFSIKLNKPFRYSGGVIPERKGFFVYVTDENGKTAIGEVSPLPGYSKESLHDAEKDLVKLGAFIKNGIETGSAFEAENIVFERGVSPSVLFGLGQAIDKLFNSDPKAETFLIKTAGLAGLDSPENTVKQVLSLADDGYDTIKLKAGKGNPSEEAAIIKRLSDLIPPNIKLRIDINGSMELPAAEKFISELEGCPIEFIEQPVRNLKELEYLNTNSEIPVAPDESVESIDILRSLVNNSEFEYIVVKPQITGGYAGLSEIIRQGNAAGKKIILSSMFESPAGYDGILNLACSSAGNYAHGLGTYKYFEKSLFGHLKAEGSSIIFDAANYSEQNYNNISV